MSTMFFIQLPDTGKKKRNILKFVLFKEYLSKSKQKNINLFYHINQEMIQDNLGNHIRVQQKNVSSSTLITSGLIWAERSNDCACIQ